jgi:4-hydroxy-tetrahydrodipicolinate synthase
MTDPTSLRRDLKGIVVPVMTPFDPVTLDVRFEDLGRQVDHLIDAGVHGLITNAGASEFYHLDDEERRAVAEFVVARVAGRVPVLVGVGSSGTRNAIAFARHAESVGADGVMLMAPFYGGRPRSMVVNHFVATATAIAIPMLLYDNPFATNVTLSNDDIVQIVEAAGIPWIKLTTKHVENVPELVARLEGRASIFEGFDPLALFSLMNGAVGWVCTPANAFPGLCLTLWRLAAVERDLAGALAVHHAVREYLDCILAAPGGFLSGLKESCRIQGRPMGVVRPAFRQLDDTERADVERLTRAVMALGYERATSAVG